MGDSPGEAAQVRELETPRFRGWRGAMRPNGRKRRRCARKDLGIWQTLTWHDLKVQVEAVAAGLSAQGLTRGAHVALVGENRPRLYVAMIAVQALGAVPVPMYQDAAAQEMVFVFENAEIHYAIVEDQEQVDKMLEVRERYPALGCIVYDDPRGLRNYDRPELFSYEGLLEMGRGLLRSHPGFVQAEMNKGSPDDPPRCSTRRAPPVRPRASYTPTAT